MDNPYKICANVHRIHTDPIASIQKPTDTNIHTRLQKETTQNTAQHIRKYIRIHPDPKLDPFRVYINPYGTNKEPVRNPLRVAWESPQESPQSRLRIPQESPTNSPKNPLRIPEESRKNRLRAPLRIHWGSTKIT